MIALFSKLSEAAAAAGFEVFGAVDIALAQDYLRVHLERYETWVRDGMAAEMNYLTRDRASTVRRDPGLLMSGAKSILCFGVPYSRNPCGYADSTQGPRFARYLKGSDYHHEIKARLDSFMTGLAEPDWVWKTCVDTSAILERSWAAAAGLGWLGKNTSLINSKLGSYFFIGLVLLNREVNQAPAPKANACGNCRRCIEACPSGALSEAGLDSRRCISYLTLEKRGEFLGEDIQVMKKARAWVAGCDLCQEACPHNKKASRDCDAPVLEISWVQLLQESAQQYQTRFKFSALNRIKPLEFDRNLTRALENVLETANSELKARLRPFVQSIVEQGLSANPQQWANCSKLVSES